MDERPEASRNLLPPAAPAALPIIARRVSTGASTVVAAIGLALLVTGGSIGFGMLLLLVGALAAVVTSVMRLAYVKEAQATQALGKPATRTGVASIHPAGSGSRADVPVGASPIEQTLEHDAADAAVLKRTLAKEQYLEGVETLAQQAVDQFQQLGERYSQFQETLAAKFRPGELTYDRYFEAARQVQLGVLDRLQAVSRDALAIHAMKPRELRDRLDRAERAAAAAQAAGKPVGTAVPPGELEALRERLALAEKTVAEARARLSENERAITQLDATVAALRDLRTGADRADGDLDASLERLRELAARAPLYSSDSVRKPQ